MLVVRRLWWRPAMYLAARYAAMAARAIVVTTSSILRVSACFWSCWCSSCSWLWRCCRAVSCVWHTAKSVFRLSRLLFSVLSRCVLSASSCWACWSCWVKFSSCWLSWSSCACICSCCCSRVSTLVSRLVFCCRISWCCSLSVV